MASRAAKRIVRSLVTKGFRFKDAHHRLLELYVDGAPTGITTFLSHGSPDYGDELLARMSRQLKLSKARLLELVDCSLDEAGYVQLLHDNAELDP